MKYYVVFPDGQKFGPADVDTLTQWAAEGRVQPTSELEDASTGARLSAASVPGLIFPTAGLAQAGPTPESSPYQEPARTNPYAQSGNPYQNPPTPVGTNYPRGPMNFDDGSKDLTKAYAFGVIGFFCCLALTAVGIYFALEAKKKGNPGGQTALIVTSVLLAINVLISIGYVALMAAGMATGF